MSNNNLATELSLLALSLALIAAMVILLVIGKINWVEAVPFLTVVGGLYGVNSALKVPSPTQQQQISTQQQSLQSLVNLLATHTHPAPPTQPVQQPAPLPPTGIGPNPPDTTTNAPMPPIVPQVQFMPPGTAIQPAAIYIPPEPATMMAYQTGMMPAVTPGTQAQP